MSKHILIYHIWNFLSYQIRWVMSNSEKILKILSELIEKSILSSKDIKKEISNDFKFRKDKIINDLDLVSRNEFEVLKKIVQNQDVIIKKLTKNKKTKKAKKS